MDHGSETEFRQNLEAVVLKSPTIRRLGRRSPRGCGTVDSHIVHGDDDSLGHKDGIGNMDDSMSTMLHGKMWEDTYMNKQRSYTDAIC